ncbi:uncharacterized protein [Maniola hyperantus]|uniref:uncharacterized protein n=1 Tax=Aphantopus hyperantus TaxID=2795564 RepID=UPI0037479C0F
MEDNTTKPKYTTLQFIQANLQRSKLATAELLETAKRKGISIALVQEPYVGRSGVLKQYPGTKVIQCTLNRQKPVKAAVIVFGDQLEVIHDPQLVTETEAAVLLVAGTLRLGVVSVYYEGDQDIEPYLVRTETACEKLNVKHLIVAGDVNAWSHWWGSPTEDQRGAAYSAFLNGMDLQILNTGNTPTFETHRGDRLCTSIVDVTACSESLLGKIRNWSVDRSITTSDHNAITFSLPLGVALTPLRPLTTRRYNTKKARWSDFATHLRTSLKENNITSERITKAKTPEELDTIIQTYINAVQEACNRAIPSVEPMKGNPKPPWWTRDLEEAKADVLRKKRRIKNAAPRRRQLVIDDYLAAKEKYTKMANDAQTESWKEFCTTQEKESMWDGIYRVIRNTARRHEDALLRDGEGNTLCPEESAKLLANTFYPEDTTATDTSYHMRLREMTEGYNQRVKEQLSEDDPPFTPAELDSVLKALNPKKAPGPDGLTSDICTKAIDCGREEFMAIANQCLALMYFPMQWKVAHVVILRKPGKDDYTHPKSYRPIGLLSIFGKIVEKMMVGRLQWTILPTLNKMQYGFVPQRGTEDALYDLVNYVRSEVQQKKSVLIVSLDIEGAFDNAWWPALKHQLISKKCPANLYAMVCSYLTDRKIKVNYARATYERETTKGCVQGSIGGPTFWNLILDSLLNKLTSDEVYCQAFADDVVLVISGHDMNAMEQKTNEILGGVTRWGKRNKLNFAAHKTNAMLITKKLKCGTPNLHMGNSRINLVEEIKLLGLIIDRRLTFKPHISAICKKTADIYKQLACAAKVTWGLNREITRTIYVAVIEPIVLYAASAWYPATELEMVKSQLDALQRGFAQKICRAYRTVSLTSALVLSGLLPLDLRIQEAANLFMAKKSWSRDYLPPERDLENNVKHINQPHPSHLTTIKYTILESLDQNSQDSHHITGPHIYTDGSKLEGKVGAALTWWEEGREIKHALYTLDPACTVFQAELYALHRAVLLAKQSELPVVNIMSDSRSSLELLENPKTTHPLARKILDNLREIHQDNRDVRLFWIRAHIGTPGNERADELAKAASQRINSTPNYSKIPLSYVKRKIREESVRKWQDRYSTSQTGRVTKIFFPDVANAYSTVRKIKITPLLCQAFTGHGGIAEYLHRFKLRDSPGCECDRDISESVEHIILDCPRFEAMRMGIEIGADVQLTTKTLHETLRDNDTRDKLTDFIEKIFRTATKRNSTMTPRQVETSHAAGTDSVNQTATPIDISPAAVQTITIKELLKSGEKGEPGIRLRGVATFMDTNLEALGMCFCNAHGAGRVELSPGLAALLNGSTSKNTMKRRTYNAMPVTTVAEKRCRIVRVKNKIIALFEWDLLETPFTQVSSVLKRIGEMNVDTPRRISVDAMAVGYSKGIVDDFIGCIEASKTHEVVVYEGRGEDLSFLKPQKAKSPCSSPDPEGLSRTSATLSGSEKLQLKLVSAGKAKTAGVVSKGKSMLSATVSTLAEAIQSMSGRIDNIRAAKTTKKVEQAIRTFTRPVTDIRPGPSRQDRSRADKGQVSPPVLRDVKRPLDHVINAFLEFQAITKAEQEVSRKTCADIMQAYLLENTGLLKVRLREAEASIYNNNTSEIVIGEEGGDHMAAYNTKRGFVELDEEGTKESGKPKFRTDPDDPVVVVARCTRIMLQEKILERAKTIAGNNNETLALWETPKIKWVNGVPGCGKTTWIVRNFDTRNDIVITSTTEAVNDLREKLEPKIGAQTKNKVRTMASVLANGFREPDRKGCKRLIIDEALMNHFGAIMMATKLAGASETLMIGDMNQLPYIDRENLFKMSYCRPNLIASVDQELLCTHRNPLDVAYALSEVYGGIYSSKTQIRSLELKQYTGANIPKGTDNTLYLTHTQGEKETLKQEGFGTGLGSRVNTIHEAQGATFETVVIVRTTQKKIQLLDSVPHAVVAVSRHTKSCTYYTDDSSDATALFISKAVKATSNTIRDYNIKMAIRGGDEAVLRKLLTISP